jgi:hypothetical protein
VDYRLPELRSLISLYSNTDIAAAMPLTLVHESSAFIHCYLPNDDVARAIINRSVTLKYVIVCSCVLTTNLRWRMITEKYLKYGDMVRH